MRPASAGQPPGLHHCWPFISGLLSAQAGRDDLVRAARELCEEGMASAHTPGWVDEAAVGRKLKAHAGWPDPVSSSPPHLLPLLPLLSLQPLLTSCRPSDLSSRPPALPRP